MKIYVGNLSRNFMEVDLKELFSVVGEVTRAAIITDRNSGRSCGFGFVDMENGPGRQAIQKLNKHVIDNRSLRVNEVELPRLCR